MATSVPAVTNTTLQKFVDAMIACVKFQGGSAPAAAPNAFKDRLQNTILPSESGEVIVNLRTNKDGSSASLIVEVVGSKAPAIIGSVDLAVLATKLA